MQKISLQTPTLSIKIPQETDRDIVKDIQRIKRQYPLLYPFLCFLSDIFGFTEEEFQGFQKELKKLYEENSLVANTVLKEFQGRGIKIAILKNIEKLNKSNKI